MLGSQDQRSNGSIATFKWISLGIALVCFGLLIYGSASLLPLLKATLFALEPTVPTASVFFFLCVAVTNPLSVGYAVIVLSCGAVFGWSGFIIVYFGSITGATFWFCVFRICTTRFDCQINRVIGCCCQCFNHSESTELALRAIDNALSTHPIRSAALVQLTFLPFGSVVGLLASTQIQLLPFIAACCISRLKLINYIWLARSAVDALAGDENKQLHLASLVISLTFSVTSLAVIAYYAKHKLNEMHSDNEQNSMQSATFAGVDEYRVDIEPRRKHSANRGRLSPHSITELSSQSVLTQTNDAFDPNSSEITDENASLLRSTHHQLRHSISNPLNMSIDGQQTSTEEELLSSIHSAISPVRKYRVAIGTYQANTASPRQRLHSNASPTNAHGQHR